MKADQERPKHTHTYIYKLKRQITVHKMYSREKIFIPEKKKPGHKHTIHKPGYFKKNVHIYKKIKYFINLLYSHF
jgi:hypothetical protein